MKQQETSERLRAAIVSGRWQPGERLPVRTKLVQKMGVSPPTLQRALDQLREEGFIYTRGSGGTFVSDQPPHLYRYGLVMSRDGMLARVGIYRALQAAVRAYEGANPGVCFNIYAGAAGPDADQVYSRLVRDVTQRRIAGLIFGEPTHMFRHTPVIEAPGMPRAAIGGRSSDGVASVGFDYRSWMERALDAVVAAGRKRVAIVAPAKLFHRAEELDFWRRALNSRGLESGEHWWQGISALDHPMSGNIVRLMMRGAQPDRPDALLIADDQLVSAVVAALIDQGVRIPDQLMLVAHANFPGAARDVVPIRRVGFCVSDVLRTCVTIIDQQRRGEPVAASTRVPAIYQEQFDPPPGDPDAPDWAGSHEASDDHAMAFSMPAADTHAVPD